LRPPAWSSRASRACVSRASGQAGKQTGMQIDKEAYGQPGRRPDRQTCRQAHHRQPSVPSITIHHQHRQQNMAATHTTTSCGVAGKLCKCCKQGCGYAPIQLLLVEPLHTQAVACMLTNVSISSGCARGSLRCQPQWWCCVEWLVLLTRQYGPNSSTKNTSSALRKQARSTQVLLLSRLAGLHSHAAVSADVLVSNMICRWHRSWLQQQSTCMWLHAGQQHASVALSTFHCASALAQCTLL
jgi:hypothetical protein